MAVRRIVTTDNATKHYIAVVKVLPPFQVLWKALFALKPLKKPLVLPEIQIQQPVSFLLIVGSFQSGECSR